MPRRQSKRGQPANTPTPPTPMSQRQATILLTCLYTLVWGVLWGIILTSIQKLPPVFGAIATGIQGFLSFGAVVLGAVLGTIYAKDIRSFFERIWKNARRVLSLSLGLILSIAIAICLVLISIPISQASVGSASGKLLPPPIATLAATKRHPLLKQKAPNCNNPNGTSWFVHEYGTYLSCSGLYLLMQRISPNSYADMELVQVNNAVYNQTTFRVQVQVTFQNPTDTGTFAAVLVQTPAQQNAVGGYIFTLNSEGQWQLQDVISGTNIPNVRSGEVSIDPSKPVTIAVGVRDGLLVGYINDQLIVSYNDNLNPLPGQVGLLVEGHSPSSPIFYSNFELDV